MRYLIIVLWMLSGSMSPALAQVSIAIGLPNLSIGINVPMYPELDQVPGYPVYYAPQINSNYFFYDGMYWVYDSDNWYASSWYDGPWAMVSPMAVPVFLLRVPVSYYHHPPAYFRGWAQDMPPRWGDHWGNDWQRERSGWDQWNRNSAPAPAPLPTYQREYSRDRYPSYEQQRTLQSESYHYQPHDLVVQRHYQQYVAPKAPAPNQQRPPERQQAPQQQQASQERHPQQEPQRQQQRAPQQQAPQERHPQQEPQHQQQAPQERHPQQEPQHQQQQAPQERHPQQEPQHQQQQAPQQQHQQPSGQEHGPQGQDKGKSEQPNQGHGQDKEGKDKGGTEG